MESNDRIYCFLSITATGQPTIGVLYVSSNVSNEYWTQDLANDIAHMLLSELASIGTLQPLEREHILLLMKEIDPPKVDNLEGNVIQEIGKGSGCNTWSRETCWLLK